jgi:hypothetical protein
MADLVSGEPRPTAHRLRELLQTLGDSELPSGMRRALSRAEGLVAENGALAQRRAAGDGGARNAASWLAGRFLG